MVYRLEKCALIGKQLQMSTHQANESVKATTLINVLQPCNAVEWNRLPEI